MSGDKLPESGLVESQSDAWVDGLLKKDAMGFSDEALEAMIRRNPSHKGMLKCEQEGVRDAVFGDYEKAESAFVKALGKVKEEDVVKELTQEGAIKERLALTLLRDHKYAQAEAVFRDEIESVQYIPQCEVILLKGLKYSLEAQNKNDEEVKDLDSKICE